jgi:hypothetical protein
MSAVFSFCRRYRYLLVRRVGFGDRVVAFLMLNPSTADEANNDPTIRRCIDFATRDGFGVLRILNLFAWRSTDPRGLLEVADPVGADNDATILATAADAEIVICAWGVHGRLHGRANAVLAILRPHADKLRCLGLTKSGAPRHPLYLPGRTMVEAFVAEVGA